jgi:hypothetical protein
MTSKGMMVGLVSVALAACAARPAIQATPAQRAQAVGIVVCGDTVRDVATELAISEADARQLIRATARELMTWVHRSYDGPTGARRLEVARVAAAPASRHDGGSCPIE